MNTIHTIEPAYHPKSKMGFLIDWLLTLKCNYDCSYCPVDSTGHDNSTQHPPYEKCINMLKQMYEYTDVYMQNKKNAFKDAVLNVYGGEALYHPDIEKILIATSKEFEPYADRWRIKRRLTTNATATEKIWHTVCEHIQGITFSYHSQGSDKMKTLFKNNIDYTIKLKKEYDIVVCMYPHENYWQDCVNFLEYCAKNKLNARPKLLDGALGVYNKKHFEELTPYIKNFDLLDLKKIQGDDKIGNHARGCCGGRQMCTNRNIKEFQSLIVRDKGFKGWHCSANQFFLHGNNVYGTYYTNKDCRVKLDGTRGEIANIDSMPDYISQLKKQIIDNKLPILKCVQEGCQCGTCAPKSIHKEKLDSIMQIYNN
jgi:organic radical activating enzyme